MHVHANAVKKRGLVGRLSNPEVLTKQEQQFASEFMRMFQTLTKVAYDLRLKTIQIYKRTFLIIRSRRNQISHELMKIS